jgi:ribonuclease P protein component
LIDRIRGRHAFDRLSRDGTRIRRTALWCCWCPDPDSTTTCVAFAIPRALGPAVTRNRLRRRLRAVLHDLDRNDPLPPGLLLIGARPRPVELTFDQVRLELVSLVDAMRATPPPMPPIAPPTVPPTVPPRGTRAPNRGSAGSVG